MRIFNYDLRAAHTNAIFARVCLPQRSVRSCGSALIMPVQRQVVPAAIQYAVNVMQLRTASQPDQASPAGRAGQPEAESAGAAAAESRSLAAVQITRLIEFIESVIAGRAEPGEENHDPGLDGPSPAAAQMARLLERLLPSRAGARAEEGAAEAEPLTATLGLVVTMLQRLREQMQRAPRVRRMIGWEQGVLGFCSSRGVSRGGESAHDAGLRRLRARGHRAPRGCRKFWCIEGS